MVKITISSLFLEKVKKVRLYRQKPVQPLVESHHQSGIVAIAGQNPSPEVDVVTPPRNSPIPPLIHPKWMGLVKTAIHDHTRAICAAAVNFRPDICSAMVTEAVHDPPSTPRSGSTGG
ncbi:hypothetical protein L484_015402 [Morus notabilis]|uniref:Uncharacterized protein n=1 Tax=Morus notabilis TaxID=981085 RepID=W9RG50_9ROSA|nr:hypothetical protein L484_015402 [Morus notabilis]